MLMSSRERAEVSLDNCVKQLATAGLIHCVHEHDASVDAHRPGCSHVATSLNRFPLVYIPPIYI